MKLNNKEQIQEILQMDKSREEKRNLIANIKNIKTDLGRIITVDEELDLEVGQIWNNLGKATSWTDRNDNGNKMEFTPELNGEIEYFLTVEAEGYKVQYFQYDRLFDLLSEEMDEEAAEELAEELAEDETYIELMDLLGADADMDNESEVLVPAETKMEIIEINDGREDMGYIEIVLKVKQ